MLDTLAKKIGRDTAFPERVARLNLFDQVLRGRIYDCLKHSFHEERTGTDEYIPLRERKPSVRYNLCKIVVEDMTAMVFGEGRFPTVTSENDDVVQALTDLIKQCALPQVMHEAAWQGSIGSVAILFKVLNERPFFDVMPTRFLTPEWKPEAPDELLRVTERYKVSGADLLARGYTVDEGDLRAQFWFQRVWDASAESWFQPIKSGSGQKLTFQLDEARTVQHELGFVPIVWIKNLPGGDEIDGACTFEGAIEAQIEIEYQLSQAGRGLKYSSDPLLMIREPAGTDGGNMIRSAGNALIVSGGDRDSAPGDAKLLEITGSAADAVIGYVRALRELALEVCHGNRSNADKISAAQSGRALEMLHQPLLQQADVLRTSYGDNGLLALMRMVCKASHRVGLKLRGQTLKNLSDEGLGLRWPPWFTATEGDLSSQAKTLRSLKEGGLMSRETAVQIAAPAYDIDDAGAELARIEADEANSDTRLAAQRAQVKASETVET